MLWFVIGMLVLLAGGGAVLYVVLHATSDGEDSAPFSPEDDGTALGSTDELSGQQEGGETVAGGDASESGGAGAPNTGGGSGDGDGSTVDEPRAPGEYEAGVVGGEAEGESVMETGEAPKPNG